MDVIYYDDLFISINDSTTLFSVSVDEVEFDSWPDAMGDILAFFDEIPLEKVSITRFFGGRFVLGELAGGNMTSLLFNVASPVRFCPVLFDSVPMLVVVTCLSPKKLGNGMTGGANRSDSSTFLPSRIGLRHSKSSFSWGASCSSSRCSWSSFEEVLSELFCDPLIPVTFSSEQSPSSGVFVRIEDVTSHKIVVKSLRIRHNRHVGASGFLRRPVQQD
jgi:hypothetical protein